MLDPQNGRRTYIYNAGNRMTLGEEPWGEVTYCEYSPGGRTTKRPVRNG